MAGGLEATRLALGTFRDRIDSIGRPTLRLGVTGLSRAGKTVFITALVHALTRGARLPMLDAQSGGRIAKVRLEPQPDDGVPRFQIEDHIDTLTRDRRWPDSTRAIAQLRLAIEYESPNTWFRKRRKLALDIVDYPGEWLLDLPLLNQDFAEFSRLAFELANEGVRRALSDDWRSAIETVDATADADEREAERLHDAFTRYLRACREDAHALSTLPPGRFLMPGDLEGSPALTFSPLPPVERSYPRGSLGALMARRYEAYKDVVVRPFFRDHFARLDRQVVLIDALQAMNAGPDAVTDLSRALADILVSFRPGRTNPLTALFDRRIDRLLVAATKADHLHRGDHDKLAQIVAALVEGAADRADRSGAQVDCAAIAAVRATREARDGDDEDALPLIVGTPMRGETVDGRIFDGKTEIAIFPGDLPATPRVALTEDQTDLIRFVRFRPPVVEGANSDLPNIRLDRALQFLIGDRLE